jgi:hypothetical protein
MINLTIFPKKTLATTLEHLQHLSKTIGQKHLNTFLPKMTKDLSIFLFNMMKSLLILVSIVLMSP